MESFAPRSRWSRFVRTRRTRLLAIEWVADRLVRRWLDPVELPNYAIV